MITIKISEAAIKMAKEDVRYGKMPLYVVVNANGDPVCCSGDSEVGMEYEAAEAGKLTPLAWEKGWGCDEHRYSRSGSRHECAMLQPTPEQYRGVAMVEVA